MKKKLIRMFAMLGLALRGLFTPIYYKRHLPAHTIVGNGEMVEQLEMVIYALHSGSGRNGGSGSPCSGTGTGDGVTDSPGGIGRNAGNVGTILPGWIVPSEQK